MNFNPLISVALNKVSYNSKIPVLDHNYYYQFTFNYYVYSFDNY